MSTVTVQFLAQRLVRADRRWVKAMARDGYRDDPFEAASAATPFTDRCWELYGWADAWRCEVHAIEAELHRLPEVRQALVTSVPIADDGVVYFEPAGDLASLLADPLLAHQAQSQDREEAPQEEAERSSEAKPRAGRRPQP